MFGDVAFAQAPFAALGGRTLASAMAEEAFATATLTQETIAGKIMLEGATVTGAPSNANNIWRPTQAETATGTSAQTALTAVLAVQAETGTATDSLTNTAILLGSVSETATGTAALTNTANLIAALAEVILAVATPSNSQSASLAESATATNAQTATLQATAAITELLQATDSVYGTKDVHVPVTGVQLVVTIGNTLVWAVVDDSQDPGWTIIPS